MGFILSLGGVFFIFGFIFPEVAHAWGAGIHIQQGINIINEISHFNPVLAPLIQNFHRDFLYGCIAPDIFIGKGSKRKKNHCHNWSVGWKILESAKSDRNLAFAYGYLSHLASDIIPHNFFIPNQLFKSPIPKKMGHVYWEYRCDEYMEAAYFKIAEHVTKMLQDENDRTLLLILNKHYVSFHSKKKIYFRFIKIQNKRLWSKTLSLISRRSGKSVGREYFYLLNRLSYNLIKDFLTNGKASVALNFDPIGAEKLIESKIMRRFAKRAFSTASISSPPFSIPKEILSL